MSGAVSRDETMCIFRDSGFFFNEEEGVGATLKGLCETLSVGGTRRHKESA